jgi:predicted nucleic-acid-binding protein
VRITADTNILVRAATLDDPVQGPIARALITQADVVAVTLPALCEFCWVLRRIYHFEQAAIADAVRLLVEADNVSMDRLAVEEGLALLDAGGDFADGVIAFEGRSLGGETFMSFDKAAVRLLQARGEPADIPG